MKKFATAFADAALLLAAPVTMALAATCAIVPSTPAKAQPATDDATALDPAFLEKLRVALREHPELVVIASSEHERRQREEQMKMLTQRADAARADLSKADTIGLVMGNPAGSQTYIEFLDYRCGFCKRAHDEVNQLIADSNDARIVAIMRPILGPDSETLARFAMAAEKQGKFVQANNYLYENEVASDDAGLQQAAEAIGADWAKLRTAMTSADVTARLAEHTRIGDELEVHGTPFFITPTKVHPGYVPFDQLKG
ncbi:MAG: hypothetical protein CL949_05315 [Erythrobacter sp.]|nr:hypothetical protein [Erythrobacter sp.]